MVKEAVGKAEDTQMAVLLVQEGDLVPQRDLHLLTLAVSMLQLS